MSASVSASRSASRSTTPRRPRVLTRPVAWLAALTGLLALACLAASCTGDAATPTAPTAPVCVQMDTLMWLPIMSPDWTHVVDSVPQRFSVRYCTGARG